MELGNLLNMGSGNFKAASPSTAVCQHGGIGLYPLINNKPERVYSALILVWGPYRAAPGSGLAAEPVSRGLSSLQGAQEERGGDAGIRGQSDGELQRLHQCWGLPLPALRGHEVLRAGKDGMRAVWEHRTPHVPGVGRDGRTAAARTVVPRSPKATTPS